MTIIRDVAFVFVDVAERLIRNILRRKYLLSSRVPWSIGYSDYKYDFIGRVISSNEISHFLVKKLPDRYGYRLDERAVEYPWFFSRLEKNDQIVLDAGSVLNFRQILSSRLLKGKDLFISTLYYEGRPRVKPSPSYIYEDLRSMCFRDDFFDVVCSLSTLEHVGLDNTMLYTPDETKKEDDKYSYLKVIQECKRVLKPGGRLLLSVPYGEYFNGGWFQVFDAEMILKITEEFAPVEVFETYFRYENDQWNFSTEEACRDGYCFDIHATNEFEPDCLAFSRCIICLELRKK